MIYPNLLKKTYRIIGTLEQSNSNLLVLEEHFVDVGNIHMFIYLLLMYTFYIYICARILYSSLITNGPLLVSQLRSQQI